jgi:hypothetical protein
MNMSELLVLRPVFVQVAGPISEGSYRPGSAIGQRRLIRSLDILV